MKDLLNTIVSDILDREGIELTEDQKLALQEFNKFYNSTETGTTLILTGSAGTGKTFMINLFTRFLKKMGYKVILLAPTGRAAKVITKRTQRLAYTIHHHIYSVMDDAFGDMHFSLKPNKESAKTVYIVDEASMINNSSEGGLHGGLLRDLISYVFESDPLRKLILVGDPVQLPPVGSKESPALQPDILIRHSYLEIFGASLNEVKRQLDDSGVLYNAVLLRDSYYNSRPEDVVNPEITPFRDVQIVENPYESLEIFLGYYHEGEQDRVVFITYSNYRAVKVNQAIRHNLFGSEDMLLPGDLLMVVRNNYAWGDTKLLPFIANGETGIVREIHSDTYEELYGLKWINAEIEFQDKTGETILVECKLVLDLLTSKQAQLDNTVMSSVAEQRRREYTGLTPRQAANQMRKDPYVNALQVKYGYAITGHKSQGGQWENVIIAFEPDYANDPQTYLRWTYTVFTRAAERVFLLHCPFVED